MSKHGKGNQQNDYQLRQNQLFYKIAAHIHASYAGKITEAESRQAARNFIKFCQKLIEIQTRIEQENKKNE